MSSGSSEGLSAPGTSDKGAIPTREELLKTREQVQKLLDRLPIDKPAVIKPPTITNSQSLMSDIYDNNDEEDLSEEGFFDNIEDPACQFTEGYKFFKKIFHFLNQEI